MSRSEIQDTDRDEVAAFIEKHWGSRIVMSRGQVFYPHLERGFIERRNALIVGLLTYHVDDDGMEILTLNSVLEGTGIGSSLMIIAIEEARRQGCHRVWLTTTNDKLRVIGFYQRLGFRMIAINLGVVDEARRIKPQIPEHGERGVRIRDEIVMELLIEPYIESGAVASG
ncbi:MAG: GNAT family N-acetyltransferase [Planctomycetes bacterium]|nr:GNAT family N-acetyltransferase [Planctomycetota bacterium]